MVPADRNEKCCTYISRHVEAKYINVKASRLENVTDLQVNMPELYICWSTLARMRLNVV
ncbi:hypothetical protein D3C72_2110780 [compost metagenome]